jgi:hypothetical protein
MKTTRQFFEAGWVHGDRYGRHQSPREVLKAHPGLTDELVSVYLNGQDDGIRGDRFRLDLGLQMAKAA